MAILAVFMVVFIIAYSSGYMYGRYSEFMDGLRKKYERKDNDGNTLKEMDSKKD